MEILFQISKNKIRNFWENLREEKIILYKLIGNNSFSKIIKGQENENIMFSNYSEKYRSALKNFSVNYNEANMLFLNNRKKLDYSPKKEKLVIWISKTIEYILLSSANYIRKNNLEYKLC